MSKTAHLVKVKNYEISVQLHRQDETRQQIRNALQRWQEACDVWLSAKSSVHNGKDYEAIHQVRTLKNHVDQAAVELKQALQIANAS